MKTINLRYDSRDKIFHQRFGQVSEFPDEINFDSSLPDQIQPLGDVKCTAYTTTNIAEDQDNIEFNIDDLWSRIIPSPDGADPRDVLSEAVKNGLLPLGKSERLKNWSSYWRSDLGSMDAFDNVRSTMMLIKSPVGCGTYWYQEWLNPTNDILPIGDRPISGHMYSVKGWKMINGEPHFIIEAWLGRHLYMPRATFNAALKPLGMQTWVLSTATMDSKKVKTLFEIVKDLLLNVLILMRNRLNNTTVAPESLPPLQTPPKPVLEQSKPIVEPPQPRYVWDTPVLARHSVREMCDDHYLTVTEKNVVTAVIQAESGFNIKAVNKNTNGTHDYGICQINDAYWIGPGKYFASVEEVFNNPEKSVLFMIEKFKAGHINLWMGFTSGNYLKYL